MWSGDRERERRPGNVGWRKGERERARECGMEKEIGPRDVG